MDQKAPVVTRMACLDVVGLFPGLVVTMDLHLVFVHLSIPNPCRTCM